MFTCLRISLFCAVASLFFVCLARCFPVFYVSKSAFRRYLLQPCSHVSTSERFCPYLRVLGLFSCVFLVQMRIFTVIATTMFTCLRISPFSAHVRVHVSVFLLFYVVSPCFKRVCYNHVHMSPHFAVLGRVLLQPCSHVSASRFGTRLRHLRVRVLVFVVFPRLFAGVCLLFACLVRTCARACACSLLFCYNHVHMSPHLVS